MSQVVRCLANLLVISGCREHLLACGGLRALLDVAQPSPEGDEGEGGASGVSDEVLSAVARALSNLTYDEVSAGDAVAAGALPPVMAMLRREDAPSLQEEGLMAVPNITAASAAGGGAYEAPLVACGVLEPLVACMGQEADPTVQEQACLALGNIASAHSNIATQQRALELGVLDLLPRLRRSPSAKVARANPNPNPNPSPNPNPKP